MRDRAELLVGGRVRAMWVMTFHSACARMLRAEAAAARLHAPVHDLRHGRLPPADQALPGRASGSTPSASRPASVGAQISDAKNKLRDADAYAQMVGSFFEQTVADVYRSYERELHRMNAMDFDDLLVRAVNVLELFPEVRERYASGFRHVLVDEYQDTNHAQYRWLQLLAGGTDGDAWSPQPDGGRRRRPVPGRGDAGDDGRRLARPIEAVWRGRPRSFRRTGGGSSSVRRACCVRTRSRRTATGSPSRLRLRPAAGQHARAHALRGLLNGLLNVQPGGCWVQACLYGIPAAGPPSVARV